MKTRKKGFSNFEDRMSEYLSKPKILKMIDYSILIASIVGFVLIFGKIVFEKILKISYPININWVALCMMLVILLFFGLKMLANKKARIAIQLILLVFVFVILTVAVGYAKYILKMM